MTALLNEAPQIVSIRRLDEHNFGDRIRFIKDGVLIDGTIDHVLRSGKREFVLITVDGVGYLLFDTSEVELTPAPGHPPVPHESAHPLPTATTATAPAGLTQIPAGNLDETQVGYRISMRIGETVTTGILEAVHDGTMLTVTVSGQAYALPHDKMVSVTPPHPLMSRDAFETFYEARKRRR